MTTTQPSDGHHEWLKRLKPKAGTPLWAPASEAVMIADATSLIGADPVAWAVQVGHATAVKIIAEVPEFGGGEGPFETLRMGTEATVIRALVALATGDQRSLMRPSDEALAGDREFARRGITLDRMLRGIRLGHSVMARELMAECERLVDPTQRTEEMTYVSDMLFGLVDGFATEMTQEYLAERDRWVTSAAAAREEVVGNILGGAPVDPDKAAKVLGYALDRHHLALVLWFEAGHHAAASELQRVASRVLHDRGCTMTLVVPKGASMLWAWGSRVSPFNEPSQSAPQAAPGNDIRLAAGASARGLDGFRRSHSEATAAERVARLAGDRLDWLVDYRAVELVALMSADLPRARHFARRELGALAATGGNAGELRETLRCYLNERRSLSSAAAHLHVARNTVAYRVKRAEELLGRNISERQIELQVALELTHVLGRAVLES